jgi:hypothetical protein
MSDQSEIGIVSRRRVLQAAAAILPLSLGSRVATALARFGVADTTPPLGDDFLELGAREAVTRIRRGDISAEAYVTLLLRQLEAHKNLNAVAAIDEARVLEAARAVDRLRARGAKLGAGRRIAVRD